MDVRVGRSSGVGLDVARRDGENVGCTLIRLLDISITTDVDGIAASEVTSVSTRLLDTSEEEDSNCWVVGRGEPILLEVSAVTELIRPSPAVDITTDKGTDVLVVATCKILENVASVCDGKILLLIPNCEAVDGWTPSCKADDGEIIVEVSMPLDVLED